MENSFGFFRKTGLLALLLAGLVGACVEPFEPVGLNLEGEVLVVDANLTDQPEPQTVRLTRSLAKPFDEFVEEPLTGAQVTVDVNGAAQTLRETSAGLYALPEGFRGKIGDRFRLRFTTPTGRRYESSVEELRAVSPIEKAYDVFDEKAIANTEKTAFTPANLIYVDTQDPASARNFYRWTWTLWERQDWCFSCQSRVLKRTDGATENICIYDPALINYQPPYWYDYECKSRCWDLFFSQEINVFADQFADGRRITGRLAGRVPYLQNRGALVEIRQQALTPEAYRYYDLFARQTQANGGLADTPPVPLVGNVRNLDDDREIVSGYFTAGAVSCLRYWLDRKGATGFPLGLFTTQNGRDPVPEPFRRTPFETRPPTAFCVPGDARTPLVPEGWRE